MFLLSGIFISTITFAEALDSSTPYQWTGFYVGGNVGYGWGQANEKIEFHDAWTTDGTGDNVFLSPFANKQLKPNGFVGGIQTGYNYQIKNWVPGVAIDMDYLGLDANYSSGVVVNPNSGDSYTLASTYTTNWLVTVRPRLGYAFSHFLPYITGGLAIAHEKFSQNIVQNNFNYFENASLTNTSYGWTIGVGTEYALVKHWRLMVEYLFVDLPSSSTQSTGMLNGEPIPQYTSTHSVQLDTNIIRTGLIYTF